MAMPIGGGAAPFEPTLTKEVDDLQVPLRVARIELAGRMTPATMDQVVALQKFGKALNELAPEQQEAVRQYVNATRELKLLRGAQDLVTAGYDEQAATGLAALRMQAEESRGFFDAFKVGVFARFKIHDGVAAVRESVKPCLQ